MSDHFIVDRLTALDLFEKIITGQRAERILRITGPGKIGKSHLLREYRTRAITQHNHRVVTVKLGNTLPDPPDILYNIRTQLRPLNFPKFIPAHDQYSQTKIEIKEVNAIFSKLSAQTSEHKNSDQYRHRQLTEAFLDDLATLSDHPILLCFDTFDQAQSLHGWFQEHFLTGLCHFKNLSVIVAGRTLPDPSPAIEHHCVNHNLEPLTIQHYQQIRDKFDLDLPDVALEAIHKMCSGRPGDIIDSVPLFARSGQ